MLFSSFSLFSSVCLAPVYGYDSAEGEAFAKSFVLPQLLVTRSEEKGVKRLEWNKSDFVFVHFQQRKCKDGTVLCATCTCDPADVLESTTKYLADTDSGVFSIAELTGYMDGRAFKHSPISCVHRAVILRELLNQFELLLPESYSFTDPELLKFSNEQLIPSIEPLPTGLAPSQIPSALAPVQSTDPVCLYSAKPFIYYYLFDVEHGWAVVRVGTSGLGIVIKCQSEICRRRRDFCQHWSRVVCSTLGDENAELPDSSGSIKHLAIDLYQSMFAVIISSLFIHPALL
jgi:hypothetical protein